MKIATWNVNSLKVRLPHVLQWLEASKPDVLALQETKTIDATFPVQELEDAGYKVCYTGQKTYNGVAILSKIAMQDIVTELPGFVDPQKRFLAATIGKCRILNLYVPNGSEVGSEKYDYKLHWFKALTTHVKQLLDEYEQVLLLGDFNIAPEAQDVHDPKAWEGQVLYSEPERQALKALCDLGLSDSFRLFEQPEKSFSWWDYRAAAFRRNHGLRIDHILVSKALAKVCESCVIDKEPRKWERPSDHTPVMATFNI